VGYDDEVEVVDKKTFTETVHEPIEDFTPQELLAEIADLSWRTNPDRQAQTMAKLSLIWEQFATHQREEVFNNIQAHVARIAREPVESRQQIFEDILALPDDSDIARALAYNPANHIPYTAQAWEKPYLDLPGFIGRFVDCYKESHVPTPYFAWAGLATLSLCCKYHVYAQTGAGDLQMNMFLFFVGDSGAGKSYAKDCIGRVITRLNRMLDTKIYTPMGPKTAPRLSTWNRPDLHINFLPEDATGESVIDAMAQLRKTTLVKLSPEGTNLITTGFNADAAACTYIDEVATHFAKTEWAVDKKLATYTAMYSQTTHTKATVGRGTQSYDHQAFSLIACGASEWFRGALSPVMMEGGFMDRSQFIYRPKSGRIYPVMSMPIIDPLKEEALARELIALATPPTPLRLKIPMTPGAIAKFNEISEQEFREEIEISRGLRPAKEGYHRSVTRREMFRIKVSSLLAVSETPNSGVADPNYQLMPVTEQHVALAEFLISNEDSYFGTFLTSVNAGDDMKFARWLLNIFMGRRWEPMEQRFLVRKATRQGNFSINDKADFELRMEALVEFKLVKLTRVKHDKSKKGPAAKMWEPIRNERLWALYTNADQWDEDEV